MSQVTLYYASGVCSLVPHILLRQLGISFKAIEMKFREEDNAVESADGSISKEEYRKINPAGYVPVLVVDGEVITEQFAVSTMVALLSPDKEAGEAFLGREPLERVRVTQWMVWLSDTMHSQGFGAFLRPERYVDNKDLYPDVRARGLKKIEYCYNVIDKRLGDRTYVVGEHLTVVDLFVYVLWRWAVNIPHIDMKERFPAYAKLVQRVEGVPGVREAVQKEGGKLQFE
ncbi:glutathione S-transferase [Xylaria digitata]|nr:glutathione S-transferase [Xylaria digitata]